jgi:DNA primase
MAIFTKESLETLRQRIDLVEVLTPHVEFKRSGAAYKALCPFHDEKSPSFMIQKGDSHYHCFGCGAHGDAIQFLMAHVKLTFADAVRSLAQQFHVHLEETDGNADGQGVNKALLKEALGWACSFYQFNLLHTAEGHEALRYLYSRGIDLDFVRRFQIGWAPRQFGAMRAALHSKRIKDSTMVDAGLLSESAQGGRHRDFFSDRIMFPIRDPQGAVIGFSGRKWREETFGGKYVNTQETALFKKSRVLFGLNYCRKRIIKERRAIIVEGQIDALRLINEGFNIAVAGQGTAFGEGHARELIQLGVGRIDIATDGDDAGREAACKIGNLFQREGVEVFVVPMPPGGDPDSFLRTQGAEGFLALMNKELSYLEFLVDQRARGLNIESPAGKNELVQGIVQQIREWKNPVMVHESLRQLAHLANVPEELIGVGEQHIPHILIKKSSTVEFLAVDPDRILEFDFLRWLLVMGQTHPHFFEVAIANITPEGCRVAVCKSIYQTLIDNPSLRHTCDWLYLASQLEDREGQAAIAEILHKKINKERAEEQFAITVQRILDRNWMEVRENVKMKIQSGECSDEEMMDLIKEFDDLKRNPPKAVVLSSQQE